MLIMLIMIDSGMDNTGFFILPVSFPSHFNTSFSSLKKFQYFNRSLRHLEWSKTGLDPEHSNGMPGGVVTLFSTN